MNSIKYYLVAVIATFLSFTALVNAGLMSRIEGWFEGKKAPIATTTTVSQPGQGTVTHYSKKVHRTPHSTVAHWEKTVKALKAAGYKDDSDVMLWAHKGLHRSKKRYSKYLSQRSFWPTRAKTKKAQPVPTESTKPLSRKERRTLRKLETRAHIPATKRTYTRTARA